MKTFPRALALAGALLAAYTPAHALDAARLADVRSRDSAVYNAWPMPSRSSQTPSTTARAGSACVA